MSLTKPERFFLGYGKYWDTTDCMIADDTFDLWVSVFWDGGTGTLLMFHDYCTVEWLEDLATKPKPPTNPGASSG